MLVAENLTRTYHKGAVEVRSLRGVDLTVEKGELLFIVGPSGSGKSTLLNLHGALDRPNKGRVLLDGEDVFARSDRDLALLRRHRFGFVFQSFNLIPTLSALDNVLLPLLPEGIDAQGRKDALDLLDRLGLADRTTHRPWELSGGEQQRVALARALVGRPEIVYADEPTGELDSERGAEIVAMIRKLNEETETTVLIVTHAVQHILKQDRVLHLRDGRFA